VAILIMLPILTFIGNGVGILGALLIAVGNRNIAAVPSFGQPYLTQSLSKIS
jgi:ABC-type transporter Mla maintaining outer membrane lipid asymmetry permease subunit MlaE